MIVVSVVVFFLMILAYFLTTRFHFYEFLEGDFENYGVETLKTNELPGNNPNYGYEMDSTNRNQNLMKGYWSSIIINYKSYQNIALISPDLWPSNFRNLGWLMFDLAPAIITHLHTRVILFDYILAITWIEQFCLSVDRDSIVNSLKFLVGIIASSGISST